MRHVCLNMIYLLRKQTVQRVNEMLLSSSVIVVIITIILPRELISPKVLLILVRPCKKRKMLNLKYFY